MKEQLRSIFDFLFNVDRRERLKVLFLSLSFFLVIGAYTVARELKDSIFSSIVGRDYVPQAKLWTVFLLIPAILAYSRLVDGLRRYQLLYFFSVLYGIAFLAFAYFLGHPVYGLANTDTGPWRILGWMFYFCIDSFSPFLISVFWAFANSITAPNAAKRNYTIIIAGSKLGGICASLLAIWLLGKTSPLGQRVADVTNHQLLIFACGLILLFVPVVVYMLMRKIPGKDLHGYEAAYKVEKKRSEDEGGFINGIRRLTAGLIVLLKYPYMLGIFGMIFFYEVINVVFGYARLGIGQASTDSLSGFSALLLTQAMYVHAVGLLIVLFGARTLVNLFGEKRCLLLVPITTGILVIYYLSSQSATAVSIVYVLIRSINYAFANPLREALYIPTLKEMKFKARSWIDAFGARSAKATGSLYNMYTAGLAESGAMFLNSLLFAIIIGLWTLNAFLVGRRYEKAVEKNEVIGA